MHDTCEQFIQQMKVRLATMVEPEKAYEIIEVMTYELRDYDMVRKTTDIVPYCDDNQKAVNSYLACLIVEGKSKSTVRQYRYSLKKLFEFCGNKTYDSISQRDILAWLASLKVNGCAPATVRNQRSNVSSFFKWMTDNGYIDKNPCSAVRPIKVPQEERRAFSSEELDTIRSACENLYERAFVELLMLRACESKRWRNSNWKMLTSMILSSMSKTAREQRIGLLSSILLQGNMSKHISLRIGITPSSCLHQNTALDIQKVV